MNRDPARRSTRFGSSVTHYGTARLVEDLHACGLPLLTTGAVHEWLAERGTPNLATAAVIARLSRGRVRPSACACAGAA